MAALMSPVVPLSELEAWFLLERKQAKEPDPYARSCFICHKSGRCGHREPAVELAIIESLRRAEQRKAAGGAQ